MEDVGFGSGRAWQLVLMTWGASAREGATAQAGNKRPVQPFRPTPLWRDSSCQLALFFRMLQPRFDLLGRYHELHMITLVGEHLGRYGNSGEVYLLPKPLQCRDAGLDGRVCRE